MPLVRLFPRVVLLLLLPTAAHAALVINEVQPNRSGGGRGDGTASSIELYNGTASGANLGGYSIRTDDGAVLGLPPVVVPAGDFLVLHMEAGVNDLDFSDGAGDVYLASGPDPIVDQANGIGLYDPSSTIVDYVGFGRGVPPAGTVTNAATLHGLTAPGAFIDLGPELANGSWGRVPDGRRDDLVFPHDWTLVTDFGNNDGLANPEQQLPLDGSLVETSNVTLDLRPLQGVASLHIQVATDAGFGTIVVDQVVPGGTTSDGVNLPDGQYYWRVRVTPSGGPELPQAAVWSFAVLNGGPSAPRTGVERTQALVTHFVPYESQHKDTGLLCVWNMDGSRQAPRPGRPGCDPNAVAGQFWDAPHANNHAPRCLHCGWYCARACISMMNAYYNGGVKRLSQDRVSYEVLHNVNPGPEGDLGHDLGLTDPQVTAGLDWALGTGANVQYKFFGGAVAKLTFQQIVDTLTNRGPYIAGVPNHVVIVDGAFSLGAFQFVHVSDPWPTKGPHWESYATFNGRTDAQWIPDSPEDGTTDEASITMDTDGDGVVDFDEGHPRDFQSRFDNVDTDLDQIPDKLDIFDYVFHRRYHAAHNNNPLNFPDIDGDRKRAENDCDSDNDGDFDGGEDINGNGQNPEAGETCVFDAASSAMALTVSVDVCEPGQGRPEPMGGTFHASSTYNFAVIPGGCTPPDSGAALPIVGAVTTDASGTISSSFTPQCFAPGTYLLVVDAIANGVYDPGCDPITCFFIDQAVATGAVQSLTASGEAGHVTLSWTVWRDGAASFIVWRAVGDGAFERLTPEPIADNAKHYPSTFQWKDATAPAGATVQYKLEVPMSTGGTEWVGPVTLSIPAVPRHLALHAAQPNPFTHQAVMAFDVPAASSVSLVVYDASGRRVRTIEQGARGAGYYRAAWDGATDDGVSAAPGVYLVRLQAGAASRQIRVVRTR